MRDHSIRAYLGHEDRYYKKIVQMANTTALSPLYIKRSYPLMHRKSKSDKYSSFLVHPPFLTVASHTFDRLNNTVPMRFSSAATILAFASTATASTASYLLAADGNVVVARSAIKALAKNPEHKANPVN